MEARSEAHLEIARANYSLAYGYFRYASTTLANAPSPTLEWTVVIAFYAAVHFVNAHEWERTRTEPRDHQHRKNYVRTHPVLKSHYREYQRLSDHAWSARYARGFQLSPSEIQADPDDLFTIATMICADLGTAV